jgi:hypothetical protein
VVEEARRWGLVHLETSSANPAAIGAFRRQGFLQHGSLPLPPWTPAQWHGGSAEVFFHMDFGLQARGVLAAGPIQVPSTLPIAWAASSMLR